MLLGTASENQMNSDFESIKILYHIKFFTRGLHFIRRISRIFTILYKIKPQLENRDWARKIAGCHFQAKKTSFSDSEGEDSADSSSSPKRKFDDISEMDKRDEPKVKLKKLCIQLLRQVPGESLTLELLKALIDEQSSIFSNFSSKREGLAFLKQKLVDREKFAVEGKRATLPLK